MRTIEELKILQSLPLDIKIAKTQARIREWVNHYGVDGVYVSFSGGKDSTVLLDIARRMYPEIEAVFVDTGLEYPKIRKFVKSFDNVTIIKPEMLFVDVIKKYGYPFFGKEIAECIEQGRKVLERNDGTYNYRLLKLQGKALDKNGNISIYNLKKYEAMLYVDFIIGSKCCSIMKKKPLELFTKLYDKYPMTAQLAKESRLRTQQWLKNGCNGFDMKSPISNPMSFWTEQDILLYIKDNNIKIADVYGDIVYVDKNGNYYDYLLCDTGTLTTTKCKRTGCMFCAFGCQEEKGEGRFQMLKRTYPRQYDYCMNGGEYNEQGLWQPNSKGLGMKHCIDVINNIYGKDFIKY